MAEGRFAVARTNSEPLNGCERSQSIDNAGAPRKAARLFGQLNVCHSRQSASLVPRNFAFSYGCITLPDVFRRYTAIWVDVFAIGRGRSLDALELDLQPRQTGPIRPWRQESR